MDLRFTRSARKHRVGRGHVLYVMGSQVGEFVPATEDHDPQVIWVGPDDRGVELEIVAVLLPDLLLVIHAMPNDFRRRTP